MDPPTKPAALPLTGADRLPLSAAPKNALYSTFKAPWQVVMDQNLQRRLQHAVELNPRHNAVTAAMPRKVLGEMYAAVPQAFLRWHEQT